MSNKHYEKFQFNMQNVLLAGRTPVGGQSTHLPLKVNAAGVIPVIFAVSFIVTPRTIAIIFWNKMM